MQRISRIAFYCLLAVCTVTWIGSTSKAQMNETSNQVALDAYNNLSVTLDQHGILRLYNIEDPRHPSLLSRLFLSGNPKHVALAGSHVLVSEQEGLQVIDIADPRDPVVANTISLGAEATVLKGAGDYGYAAFDSTIVLFDIPTAAILDRRAYSDIPVRDLALSGDNLYILFAKRESNGAHVVMKVAIQDHLDTPLATLKIPQTDGANFNAESIYSGNTVLYICSTGFRLAGNQALGSVGIIQDDGASLKIASPPSPIAAFEAKPNGSGLLVFTTTKQDSSQTPQLGLVDLQNPDPVRSVLKTIDTPGAAHALILYSGFALMPDDKGEIQAISIALPNGTKSKPRIDLATNFADGTAIESSLMRLTANVTGSDQIATVEFFVNGVKVATDGNYPFEYRFMTPELSAATSISISACAHDVSGNQSCTDGMTLPLVKDTHPLRVISSTPQNGARFSHQAIPAISARFSHPLDFATIVRQNVTMTKSIGGKSPKSVSVPVASVSYQPGTHTLSVAPASPLTDGNYTVSFSPAIKSSAGMPLTSGYITQFAVASGATWISSTSGNWNVGSNWLSGTPPQAGDDVTIAVPGVTVTFNQGTVSVGSLSVASGSQLNVTGGGLTITGPANVDGVLSMSAGTLTPQGGLTVSQLMNWNGGIVSGPGGLTIATTATLNITSTINVLMQLSGGTLNNQGTVNQTEAGSASLQVVNLGVINNTGSWNITADVATVADTTAVVFNNSGSFTKSGGTGTTTWSVPISGPGTINIASGTLNLTGKLLSSITGAIAVQASAKLNYGQGGTLAGGQVTGSGTLIFTNGVTINGSYTFSGQTQIQSGSGVVAFNGSTTIANLNFINGTLTGTGAVTISGTMNWNGGTLAGSGLLTAGSLALAANATVNIELGGRLVSVVGNLTLAGNLNLIDPGGFLPPVGSIVDLFTFSSGFSGGFGVIGGETLSNGDILSPQLTDAGLSFLVTQP